MGARGGLEGDGVHAGDLGEHGAEVVHEPEGTLDRLLRLEGMDPAKPGILAAASLILGLYFMVQEPRG